MTDMKTKFLFIVPCGNRKIWDIDPFYKGKDVAARFAYKGALSRSTIACVQSFEHLGHPFLILSTKYGFLDPDKTIGMYREEQFIVSDQILIKQGQSQVITETKAILVLALTEYYYKTKLAFQDSDIEIIHLLKFCTNRGEQMHYIKTLKERAQEILRYHKEEPDYLLKNFKEVFFPESV